MKGPRGTVDEWFTPGRFAFLTGCLMVACFPGVITGRDAFFFRDFAIFSYPLAAYHKACFWQGEIPLWNPYNDCGLPFLAQWNTMVLYPLSLIYLLFPLSWSLSVFCLFHMWLGGMGMFFLARAWTQNHPAAALAGFAYLFNGVVLSCLKWPNNIAALGCMPWVVLAADRSFQGNVRALCLAALAGAVQMLSGAPEIILLTWLTIGALWLYRTAAARQHRFRVFARLPSLVALVAGLSAAQLLPFLHLLQKSQRDSAFLGSQWPMPPWGWANFILPLFRMFPSYHDVHAQPGQYWISTYYVAIAVLLLAIVALIRVRDGKVWLLGGLLLFSMWMALGERGLLYKVLRATVPGLGMMRFPIKFIVLAAFVLPLLGALGLDHLLRTTDPKRRLVWIPTTFLAAGIGWLIIYSELHPYRYSLAFLTTWNGVWRLAFLAGSALALSRLPRGRFTLPILFAFLIADGLTHTTWQNPVAPRWVYEGAGAELHPAPTLATGRAMISPEAAETVDHLKLSSPAEDVLASRLSLYCNLNLLDRVPKVDGFFAIYPREMSELQDRLYASGTNVVPQGFLDFAGVTHINPSGSWNKWEQRPSALPLVNSAPRIRLSTNSLEAILDPAFRPAEEVIFADSAAPSASLSEAIITSLDWKPERLSFQTSAKTSSMVTIAQTFYDSWHATVDGSPTPIQRVNHAFQGLHLPPGNHHVWLEYRDAGFRTGVALSLATAAAVAGLLLASFRKNEKTLLFVEKERN